MAKPTLYDKQNRSKAELPLITDVDIKSGKIHYQHDRENIVKRMDDSAKLEQMHIIRQRYQSAKDQTEKMRDLMAIWDLQYKSVFQDAEGDDDRIFLPKTREAINVVKAFIISIISKMNPIVTMEPTLQDAGTMWAAQAEWRRAKVAEALVQFYFSDVWKVVDDILPRWVLHFLKYSMAIFKITYYETDYNPDLLLDVIDRAFLYIDPNVNKTEDSRWIIEEYFIPRTEAQERFDRGDWYAEEKDYPFLESTSARGSSDINLQRFFGENFEGNTDVREDELIQCFDYWQYPREGLGDFFATVAGGIDGILVRSGPNPFPYKGCNYVTSSFNPDDRPDGQGMCELQSPFQDVLNTFLNYRLDDVRKNIQGAAFVPTQMVDSTTQADLHDGNSLVRIAPAFFEFLQTQGLKVQDFIGQLPSGTSTGELFKDLEWILGQSKESSGTPEIFQGMNVPAGTPLGVVQEQLNRTVGSFQPVIRQVMRVFERLADIMIQYLRDPEFYPAARVISIVGKNKYADVVAGWEQIPGTNTQVREVSPDEMNNVDVKLNAVNSADAHASKTMQAATIERILQSIGQSPEIAKEVSDSISFPRLVEQMLMTGGHDIDGLMLTDEEKQKREEQKQQAAKAAQDQQMQMMEAQNQMQAKMEQMLASVRIMEDASKQEMRQRTQTAIDESKIYADNEAKMEQTIVRIIEETAAKKKLADQAAEIENERMKIEGEIEASNMKIQNVSKAGGGNVQLTKKSDG